MARPTAVPAPSAVVVVVGGPAVLVDATRLAAGIAASARVESAELGQAATVVATHRPFAIVISEDVYAFDSAEFDALARDVNASLIKVAAEGASRLELEQRLMPPLARAHRLRTGGG